MFLTSGMIVVCCVLVGISRLYRQGLWSRWRLWLGIGLGSIALIAPGAGSVSQQPREPAAGSEPALAARAAVTSPERIPNTIPLSDVLEWTVSNPSYQGNPFDLEAQVAFVHPESGETRRTGMFYTGDGQWRFRFFATQTGRWMYQSSSSDPELDGISGDFTVDRLPDGPGFVTHSGNRWMRSNGEAFVPQYVMFENPDTLYQDPEVISRGIQTFLVDHGFNGFHVRVYCRWFELEEPYCGDIDSSDPNPDSRTFEALERLIIQTYNAGGTVHFWAWGDDSRDQTPTRYGLNGDVDQRLQRYIAARLAPLPGWTMGYGYDLFEWVRGEQLDVWHAYMHQHMGWPHMLGARSNKNEINQLTEVLDYAAYEQHRPDYANYVETIEARPEKPAFSEDRFRVRDEGRSKDYSLDDTRRGLWHSTMAGGVANIWGNRDHDIADLSGSAPYPNQAQIKTYARFFAGRFTLDSQRCNELSDGYCLMRPDRRHYLFYREDSNSIQMDLRMMDGPQRAIAVNTLLPYQEIDLGTLQPALQTWQAPESRIADWAIAVFPAQAENPPAEPGQPPPEAPITAPDAARVYLPAVFSPPAE